MSNLEKDVATMKHPVSPFDVETSRFKPETIVYEDRGFIIAVGHWKDKNQQGVAIRWHVAGEIGYPNGFGKPQWMETPIRPEDIRHLNNPLMPDAVSITMRGDPRTLPIGDWAFDGDHWHLIYGLCGDGGQVVEVCGRGQADSYPLDVYRIQKVEGSRSLMDVWFRDRMGGDALLWLSPGGRVYVTMPTKNRYEWSLDGPHNLFTKFELMRSPTTGAWNYTDAKPLAFDYSLDECILLARSARANQGSVKGDVLEFDDILNGQDFEALYRDYVAGDLKKYRRQFVTDFSEDERKGIYRNDTVLGSSYYDLL